MVVEAARHIRDGDIVMVGTGLPMVASLFAQRSHAPNMCFVVETGQIAPEVIPTPTSVADAQLMHRAVKLGSLLDTLGSVLHRGLADVGFLGGAQIDQFANVNSTIIGDYDHPKVRLPGSGGANDLASHSQRLLIIARHEKRRFPAYCDHITSPGYIDGPDGRKRAGLPIPYPDITVITNLTVMSINKPAGLLRVDKVMPAITFEDVLANTGFQPLRTQDVTTVQPPSDSDIRLLREEVNPGEVYLMRGR